MGAEVTFRMTMTMAKKRRKKKEKNKILFVIIGRIVIYLIDFSLVNLHPNDGD